MSIQIQHLLKLNTKSILVFWHTICIQIQHLLKLNSIVQILPLLEPLPIQIQHLLKLNFIVVNVNIRNIPIQIQHLLKLNLKTKFGDSLTTGFKYNTC